MALIRRRIGILLADTQSIRWDTQRAEALRRAPWVRSFFTIIKGARSAPGSAGRRSWVSAARG